MIDILNQRVQINPNKEFVEYKNKNISYKQFNNIVNNISNDIKLHDFGHFGHFGPKLSVWHTQKLCLLWKDKISVVA